MEEKSFNKLNRSLHQEVTSLWDECFGDLPITAQRLIKAHGTVSSKKAYKHAKKRPITISELQKSKIEIYESDRYFKKGTPQQGFAQRMTEKIIKRLINGNNQASKRLKEFLKGKKVLVGVHKQLADDAGFDGYNPLTKELYIDLCAGHFYYNQKFPNLYNEDGLARTIGHELAHAIEHENRSSKTSPNQIGYSSNGWEVENFCDAFGTALCIGAGYSLAPSLTKLKEFEERELASHKEDNPHPTLVQRRKLLELMIKAYDYDNNSTPTQYPSSVYDIEWNARKIEQNKEKNPQLTIKDR
ncbi:MAG: hypothetical protein IJZ30_07190 [Alphaproteobacteria bacterium]|nr:hypothetical protein [Alphaproteobacteria bacterium]